MAIGHPLKLEVSIGTSPINSVFSIAMFDYRRVIYLLFNKNGNVMVMIQSSRLPNPDDFGSSSTGNPISLVCMDVVMFVL